MATLTPIQGASPLDANDSSYATFTDDLTQTLSYAVDDVDADLASMDSLSWQIDYSLRAARTDDTYALALRIMSGATVLAAADSGGTFVTVSSSVTSTTDTLSSVTAFAYVNTAASKTLWDAATVELRQTYAKTKGSDGTAIRVDFVEFTGVYTVAAPTFTGTAAVTQASDTSAASGVFSSAYREAVLADSPVAYWRLGEASGTNAADEMGTYDATYVNTPTLAASGLLTGDPNTAVTFDSAQSEYADAGSVNPIGGASAATVEVWVDRIGAGSGIESVVRRDGSLQMDLARTGNFQFWINVGGTWYSSPTFTNDTNPHHIVGVYDGSVVRLYVDGVERGTATSTSGGTVTAGSGSLFLAAGNATTGFVNATVDEIALYSTALSAARIRTHYATGINQWTGTAAPVQASDTAAASGTFATGAVTGSASPAQVNDTSTASGTFVAGPVSGTGSPVQADDTSAASGSFAPPSFTGTAAPSQAGSTSTASATFTPPVFTGTASPTQAADTSTASGSFVPGTLTGTASPTQQADTSTASGTFVPGTITGTAAVAAESDTSTASGSFTAPTFTGTAASTQDADTSSASGSFANPVFTGTAAPVQADDTSNASGSFDAGTFTGTAAASQDDDTSNVAATFTPPTFTGDATVTQDPDTVSAAGTFSSGTFTSTANITQDSQTVSASGTGGSILPHTDGKSTAVPSTPNAAAVVSNTHTSDAVINTSTGKVSLSSSGASTAEGN